MKERSLCGAVLLVVLAVMLGTVTANAQTTPTPSATPALSCTITTLPGGAAAECETGAEEPPSLFGVSGGNFHSVTKSKKTGVTCCAGTFGALVQNSTGVPFVLSTNHVLARTSSGSASANLLEPIVQPGLLDLACWQDRTDTVAQLSKWTPINFAGGENLLDAAIAKVVMANQGPVGPSVPGVDLSGAILNIGQISTTPFPFDDLVDGLPVMKMGRSSCLTSGVVDAFDAMGEVVYTNTCNNAASGTALFDHQILIFGEVPGQPGSCSFASSGDSGALVLTSNFTCPQAIGMVFAGASGAGPDSGGTIVAVNPIQTILTTLKVSLVGQTCTAAPLERQVAGSVLSAEISDTLRASIEHVRSVKQTHGQKLLAQRGVAAVGIGAGDTPDSAALHVYLTEDTPEIRNSVLSEVNGEKVTFKLIGGKFTAL